MQFELIRHPDTACKALSQIRADLREQDDHLHIRFVVDGVIAELSLPPKHPSLRTDNLWQHTCFELFLGSAKVSPYLEFNFSPSTQWAAYHFKAYRHAAEVPLPIRTPIIKSHETPTRYEMMITLDLNSCNVPQEPSDWRIGLSAVVETQEGNLSYWALAHPPGQPDFHHADCFVAQLPSD